jgi:hypothetical protein
VLSWQLQADWHFDPDMARASEVGFEFIAEGPEATRVEFEHRHLERHGERWEQIRAGVDSPGGWTSILAQFQQTLAQRVTSEGLSETEREYALAELREAEPEFQATIANLTPEQWSFRPGADRWSPSECVEHIAVIEAIVLDGILPKALQSPPDRQKRKTLKYSDSAVLRLGTAREPRLNAPELVQPVGRWKTPEEILANVSALRGRTVEFVKSTPADLRNRFADHPVFGTLDLYQWILLLGAHMRRHSEQIHEVKRDSRFPKQQQRPKEAP